MMEKMEDIGGIDDIDGMEEIELKPDDDSRLIVLIIMTSWTISGARRW